jgi:hypothetical protein
MNEEEHCRQFFSSCITDPPGKTTKKQAGRLTVGHNPEKTGISDDRVQSLLPGSDHLLARPAI